MKTKNLLLGIAIGMRFSLATVAQNVPNYVPTNGLVGWWPFNGNANDESGNGNNGTLVGCSLTSDRFSNINQAVIFNQIQNIVCTQQILNNPQSFSISLWFKTNSAGWIFGFDNGQCSHIFNWDRYLSIDANGVLNFRIFTNSNTNTNINSINTFNDNNWHHCVFSLTNQTMKIYVDGLLEISSANNVIASNYQGYWRAGGLDSSSPSVPSIIGKLDDIGIWNRALTQQEISDLYNGNICYQNITVTDTLIINTNLVGFNPVTYQNSIKIFPNPTNDHITINYGNYATLNNYQLRITNSLGQQMFQTTINQQSSYINLSNWTGNGIYFVHLIDPQGNTIDIRKIVLQ